MIQAISRYHSCPYVPEEREWITCIALHAGAGAYSAAGFVMRSDSLLVMSDRSSATADTSGCVAALL